MDRIEDLDDDDGRDDDELSTAELLSRVEVPRGKPGRPRKHPVKGTAVRTTTTREIIGPADSSDDDDSGVAPHGFEALLGHNKTDDRKIVRVRVQRKDPDDGVLGYLEEEGASEEVLKERWGGGSYFVQGLDAKSRVVLTANFRIAGDPIFMSDVSEARWRKANGMPPKVPVNADALTPMQVMTMIRDAEEKKRAEEKERLQLQREADERAETKRREDERRFVMEREKAQRDWEEAKRKDEADREERRRKDDADREERRRADMREADTRRQEHMQQMLMMVQKSSEQALSFMKMTAQQPQQNPQNSMVEAVKLIAVIKDAFAPADGGGGDEDTMQTLLKNIGPMLNGAGNVITGAIREIKGGGAQPQVVPQLAAVQPGGISLPPALSGKVETLVSKLIAKGVDPEQAIGQIVDNVNAALDGQVPQSQPQPQPPRVVVPKTTVNGQVPHAPKKAIVQTTTPSGAIKLAAPPAA